MSTDCSAERFAFAPVDGRAVVAAFDGGTITSDAGVLLLGATDRAIGLVPRFASCFVDHRAADQVEHSLPILVGQRVFALALGYEDLVDHDHCGTTRRWLQSTASSPHVVPAVRRWPASRPSTGSSTRRPGRPRAITRSATTGPRSSGCSSSCSSTHMRAAGRDRARPGCHG